MIPDPITTVLLRPLDPREILATTVRLCATGGRPRETLKLGCSTCGSQFHGKVACPLADEKGGIA